ncbi:MAG: hypothetical protein PSX81_07700 [bacterium]|nr:hypothetical protein [bacterium]
MKAPVIKIILTAVTILLLTQCKKEEVTYKAYFYTMEPTSEIQLSLYIDGKYQDKIPYLHSRLSFDNDTLKQKALLLTIKCGKHKLDVKDSQGNLKSSGIMKITKNKTSLSGRTGEQEINRQNGCLIVRLDS